jgi:hypothetical protein
MELPLGLLEIHTYGLIQTQVANYAYDATVYGNGSVQRLLLRGTSITKLHILTAYVAPMSTSDDGNAS